MLPSIPSHNSVNGFPSLSSANLANQFKSQQDQPSNGNDFSGSKIIKCSFDSRSTTVVFITDNSPNGKPFKISYNNIFLRDSSRSSNSIDPATGAKLITTGEILINPIHSIPSKMAVSKDRKFLEVLWSDGDFYAYPLSFLYRYKGTNLHTKSLRYKFINKFKLVIWNNCNYENLQLTKQDFATDDFKLYKGLIHLQKFGIIVVNDTPDLPRVAHRIGPVTNTIHGSFFNQVESKKLHMDLQYIEHVPGLKIMKVMENTEFTFVDTFHITGMIKEIDAEAYDALLRVPINYSYELDDHRYYQSRPLIQTYSSNEHNVQTYEYLIKNVNYCPMWQAPFTFGIYNKLSMDFYHHDCNLTLPSKAVERFRFKDFLRGLELFERLMVDPANQVKLQLPKNTTVLLNNRRIAHAAAQEDCNVGVCFLDIDHFKSKLKYLEEKFK
ncbi:hypothetical protein KAFR_0K00830 [Kazachstania africana CBS 2517]|uniref:TauD/TfdA-like domain-containing protein n=1 Tax=Kazachstania africana (strain ATCC 22294 / BCRC 22015 / CBS 2517 / CECT 1963 / NBRC 1671 / NRRL Y-8276) TaxID=1071382 RepID=H2B1D8_KAZAF|nr:hypothetical protein KAFR_0K00830 [Kazachstania africana CBS 2517]CCF60438.1 hypothetical protein KAFR_0K00830 [Kazachstania africana CBS 2517]